MSSYIKTVSPAIILEVLSQVIAVVSIPIIIINLSIKDYTIFSSLMILIMIFQQISIWGLSANINEELPKSKQKEYSISQYFISNFYMQLISIIIFIIIIINYNSFFPLYVENKILLAAFICFFFTIFNQMSIIQALDLLHKYLWILIISKFVFLVILISFIDKLGTSGLLLLYGLSNFPLLIISYLELIKKNLLKFELRSQFFINPIYLIINSTKTHIITLTNSHFFSIFAFISSFFWPAAQLANLNFLTQLFRPGSNISEIFFRLTRLSYNLGQRKPLFFKNSSLLIILFFLFSLITIFGEPIYKFFIRGEFSLIWNEVSILLIIIFLNIMQKLLLYDYFPRKTSFHKTQNLNLKLIIFNILPIIYIIFFSSELSIFLLVIIVSLILQLIFSFYSILKNEIFK